MKNKKILIITVIAIVILLAILVTADIVVVKVLKRGPIFAFNTAIYEDGGTKEYTGFGYKVIDYNITDGKDDIVIGPFWMSYSDNVNKGNYTIVDETDMCAQALEEIARDDNYIYYLNCIKSGTIFLKYSDGTKISIREALRDNKVTIYDLIDNGLQVEKVPL